MNPVQTYFFGRLCYGYMRGTDGQVFIDEQQTQTVSFIFEQYLCGGLAKIVELLQEQEIPSPTRVNRDGHEPQSTNFT